MGHDFLRICLTMSLHHRRMDCQLRGNGGETGGCTRPSCRPSICALQLFPETSIPFREGMVFQIYDHSQSHDLRSLDVKHVLRISDVAVSVKIDSYPAKSKALKIWQDRF
jgi:hypothetical protein